MRRPILAKRRQFSPKFFVETMAELKKVVWPSRQEIRRLTIMVVVVCLVAGAILGVLDYGFTQLVDLLLGGK